MNNLFQFLWTGYQPSLAQAVAQVVATELTEVNAYIAAAVGLYVIMTGVLMMNGDLMWGAGVRRAIRAIAVLALLQPAAYNQYIVTFFSVTVPAQAAAVAPNGAGFAMNAGPQGAGTFDTLSSAVEHAAAAVEMQMVGPSYIAQWLIVGVASWATKVCILFSFLVWSYSLSCIYYVVAVGPFLILMWLFTATAGIPMRWIGVLVGLSVLLVMIFVEIAIVEQQQVNYMKQVAVATPGNVDEQVDAIINICLAFLYGTFQLVGMPFLAAAIGGGAVMGAGPFVGRLTGYVRQVGR